MELYDTHSHLDYPEFNTDIETVIKRAMDSGVSRVITVGTDIESSQGAIAISERFEQVYAAIGWHPSSAERAPEDITDELFRLTCHPKVVAIGESGLDFYRLPSKENPELKLKDEAIKKRERELFIQHLKVAEKSGLNVIIHQRESFADVFETLSEFKSVKAVFHCFTDSDEVLQKILNSGWIVSYTGIVTFKNARDVRMAVKNTPLNKMMVETDCPFLAPVPHRGKRCEPAFVKFTAETIAEIKQCSLEELAQMTCSVAKEFFKFNKS